MEGFAQGAVGEARLQPGEILAGRFTIVQFLARGGMGEVYEAADNHLQGKHLALKTVRPEIAGDATVRQRFEREVLLAREISHRNVCPTYDLFRVDTLAGPLMFLTMKLLRGESLAARLSRSGPMTAASVLPIARQMAEALDAAHHAGVIHRDFKPGNVMLESAGDDARVSITDFGLSRAFDAEGTIAHTGRLSGTLGYIAPELLQGRIATSACDIYAFGVVLHEMLTGEKPRLKPGRTDFVRPSKVVQGVPRNWDRVVLGCLEHDPKRRFQSAGEALAALDSTATASRSIAMRRDLSPRLVAGLAALVAVLVGAAVWLDWPAIDRSLHPLPENRFVALMAWPTNAKPENGPVLKGVLDAAGARIARAESSVKKLLVISSNDVAGQAPLKTPADAVSALGANVVLAASLVTSGSAMTLRLQVLDAGSGRVLRHEEIATNARNLNSLPERAAEATAGLLNLPALPKKLSEQDELAHTTPDVFRYFTAAEDLKNQPNDIGLDQAIETYQKALDADPHFALGYARIAIAYIRRFSKSGDEAALRLASKNAELAKRYNPDSASALASVGLVSLYSGKTEEAVKAFDEALRVDPGNPRVLMWEAAAFRDLGRSAEEEKVYREILEARPNFWPAYLERGYVLYRRGDRENAAKAFQDGSQVAPKVALLVTNLGSMQSLLGDDKAAEATYRKSLGVTPNEAAYRGLGTIAYKKGDYTGAIAAYREAAKIQPKTHGTWRDLGDSYAKLGNSAAMRESYTKAAELLSESLRTNPRRGGAWMTLAVYEARLGRREAAEADIRNAEARGPVDAKFTFEKAEAVAILGRKEEALGLVLDAVQHGLSTVEVELAPDLDWLRADPRYQSFLAKKNAK
jgi:tetratricopeptide (TPR) repeat protein/tRNA A-37 threonylcarbamoyl transferase component Bud32